MKNDLYAELLQTGEYLSPHQAARRLGYVRRHIFTLCADGLLKFQKTGESNNSRVLISKESVERYLSERKPQGRPARYAVAGAVRAKTVVTPEKSLSE